MKIAVIAHDGKKAEMVAFLNRHMDFLKSVGTEIVATGTTGKHAQDAGLEVERLLSGPLGGDVHNVPIATNPASAEMMIRGFLDMHQK